jgi:hypothetical protein
MSDKDTWGPVFWWVIHDIAAHYPIKPTEEMRQSVVRWITDLAPLLPCKICSIHLLENLKANPIYDSTETREKLQQYFYDLHEIVNKQSKKAQKHTFEEVKEAFKVGKAWKEWGGYPIKTSPRIIEVDPKDFLSNFAEKKDNNQNNQNNQNENNKNNKNENENQSLKQDKLKNDANSSIHTFDKNNNQDHNNNNNNSNQSTLIAVSVGLSIIIIAFIIGISFLGIRSQYFESKYNNILKQNA